MANWSNPILTSTYTNFVTEVKDRDTDVAVWFEGVTPTNTPTNAKRLNTTNGRFEKWNGTAWVDAVATFAFPALSVAGASTFSGAATFSNATSPIISAKIGPAAGQQHTVPAVTSDTLALLAATQTFTNKTYSGGAKSGTFSGNHTLSGQASFTNATAPIISAKLGPSSTQQHTLPAVTSDTVALLAAPQTLIEKSFKDTSWVWFNSTTNNALDFTNGSYQRWTPNTGAQTLSITNWPASGNLGELLIEGVNLGAATITWPTIYWVKSDGSVVTNFANNGVTLRTSGTDFVMLWTRDAGAFIYGKIIR
jgi:hypothetical protein